MTKIKAAAITLALTAPFVLPAIASASYGTG
jgi:multisubunit Na+/H+ antiporter MnhG subunit